jgi:Zn-dependent protease
MTQIISNLQSELQALLFTAPVVLLAIICHECAHGWVSYKLGDPTAKQAGRLTLNPLKHLDVLGTICMLFFHVGWAKPVPINPLYYKDRKKGIIYVSFAGPLTNVILAYISLLIEGMLLKFGSDSSVVVWIFCQLCYYSAVVNIGLGLFNLIPIPPLDGSKIVGELSHWAAEIYYRYERYWRIILLILVFTGILSKPLSILNETVLNLMWSVVKFVIRL